MCFSATASFVASGVLTLGGVATLGEAKEKKEVPLATFPLLFAIQQGIEGMVWLSFSAPALNGFFVYLYAMFSHVLWPIFTPIAILLIEDDPARIKLLRMCAAVGALTSLYLLISILREPVTAHIVHSSIAYHSPNLYPYTSMLMYLIATCGSCFLSSHRLINFFGAVLFLSFLIAYLAFNATFFSVWCFFAAILSLIIYIHVRMDKKLPRLAHSL